MSVKPAQINVFIPGAGRSGTTTLYTYLSAHPQISFTSLKEVHFFTQDDLYSRGENYLHRFLSDNDPTKLHAGADTYALTTYKAAKRLAQYNPSLKLLFMLRHPVERALSGYRYAVNMGYMQKPEDWHAILKQEEIWLATGDVVKVNNLCNVWQGLYYCHLNQWLKYFPFEQMLLLTTRELNQNPEAILQRVARFLDVQPFNNQDEALKVNAAKSVRNKFVQQLLLNRNLPLRKFTRKIFPQVLKDKIIHSGIIDRLHRANTKAPETIHFPESFKATLYEYYKEDMQKMAADFGVRFDKPAE